MVVPVPEGASNVISYLYTQAQGMTSLHAFRTILDFILSLIFPCMHVIYLLDNERVERRAGFYVVFGYTRQGRLMLIFNVGLYIRKVKYSGRY